MKGGFAAFFLVFHPCFLLLGKVIDSGGGKGTLIAPVLELFRQFPNFRSTLHTLCCSSCVSEFWPASCSLTFLFAGTMQLVSLGLPRHVLFLLPNYFFENCIKITYPLVSLPFFVVMGLYLLFPLHFHFSVV